MWSEIRRYSLLHDLHFTADMDGLVMLYDTVPFVRKADYSGDFSLVESNSYL